MPFNPGIFQGNGPGLVPASDGSATKYLSANGGFSVPAGSGGSGAWTLIERQVLAATSSSITFSSLAGYEDLLVSIMARGDSAVTSLNVQCRFNGDSGTNYGYQKIQGTGTTASVANQGGTAATFLFPGIVPGSTAQANACGYIDLAIPAYLRTVFNKIAFAKNSCQIGSTTGSTSLLQTINGFWANTAAITSINLSPASGNFIIGSTFAVFGRA